MPIVRFDFASEHKDDISLSSEKDISGLSWMKKMHVFPHIDETMSLAPPPPPQIIICFRRRW